MCSIYESKVLSAISSIRLPATETADTFIRRPARI